MHTRSARGRIDYIRDGKGVSGREFFSVTVSQSGDRTLRAQCEMDDIGLLRDVIQTVSKDWFPRDSDVRLAQHGKFMGVGWFRCDATGIACEAFTLAEGRVTQRVETGRPVRIIASHPLMTDGWQCAAFDHARSDRIQTVEPWANTSPRPDGGSGPMIGIGTKVIEYVGEERITVPAGTFSTRHYRLIASNPATPPLETWVMGDDSQFVKMRWDLLRSDYVLAEYQTS